MGGHDCSRNLRKALSNFATGVTIISCRSPDGDFVGITANSFTSVSLDPPLVSFNVAKNAKSCEFFREAAHFGVSVLGESQVTLATVFAVGGSDKWNGTDCFIGGNGSPMISGAIAHFECSNRKSYEVGDHLVFIGEIVEMRAESGRKPLLFYAGNYRQVSDDVPEELEAWSRQVLTATSAVA